MQDLEADILRGFDRASMLRELKNGIKGDIFI